MPQKFRLKMSNLVSGRSKYTRKPPGGALREDRSRLPSYSNFPSGHILRKVAGYHANRILEQVTARSGLDHAGSGVPSSSVSSTSTFRATKSDKIPVTQVASSKISYPPAPSHEKVILSLGNEPKYTLASMREENVATKASTQTAKKVDGEMDTMEIITSNVFSEPERKISDGVYVQLLQNLPRESDRYLPTGFFRARLSEDMQMRALWVAYARYYQKHRDNQFIGLIVRGLGGLLRMRGYPPVSFVCSSGSSMD